MSSLLVKQRTSSPVLLSLLFCFLSVAQAKVPPSSRFQIYLDTYLDDDPVEYGATCRFFDIDVRLFNYDAFLFGFCNTTANAYTLSILMDSFRTPPIMHIVWEANRGNPVRINSSLTFGEDGNLVLADVDGRIAFQTNTANKGVVGWKLLPNGNFVLHDSKGNFIWQSFDYPTDTLLVDQSLRRVGGSGSNDRLVSRSSEKGKNSDGPYSLVLEPKGLAMYYKYSNSSSSKPYLYYTSDRLSPSKGPAQNVTFVHLDFDFGASHILFLTFNVFDSLAPFNTLSYNSTLSFLRLGVDGNLRIYTFYDGGVYRSWQETFTLFSRDSGWESECQLPTRCGKFGLCEDSQCVACPSPNGLMGWSKDCDYVKPSPCASNNFYYYKLEGVDHYRSKHTRGDGPMKENACEKKCSSDCKCLGYFYNRDTSMCWIAEDLHTLTRVGNSTHLAFIKAPK